MCLVNTGLELYRSACDSIYYHRITLFNAFCVPLSDAMIRVLQICTAA